MSPDTFVGCAAVCAWMKGVDCIISIIVRTTTDLKIFITKIFSLEVHDNHETQTSEILVHSKCLDAKFKSQNYYFFLYNLQYYNVE